MKRIRKRKGTGYAPEPFSGIRPVDMWRQWAALSLPTLKVSSSVRPPGPGPFDPVYTLEEDGVVIGMWRNSDAPWLRPWLSKRLGQLNGAWHLAQQALKLAAGQSQADSNARREQRDKARKRDEVLRKTALQIKKDEPHIKDAALAAMLADRGHGGPEAIRKKLPKLLARKKSVETR